MGSSEKRPSFAARRAQVAARMLVGAAFAAGIVFEYGAEARAATGLFLDVPGIAGDATLPPVAGQIQGYSYSWTVGQAKASKVGALGVCAAGPSKPVFSGLCFLKHTDKASPKLFLAAAQGTAFPTVVVSLYQIESASLIMKYTLSNAIVASVQTSLGSGDDLPTESVCFAFSRAEQEVTTDPASGGSVSGGFDMCTKSGF